MHIFYFQKVEMESKEFDLTPRDAGSRGNLAIKSSVAACKQITCRKARKHRISVLNISKPIPDVLQFWQPTAVILQVIYNVIACSRTLFGIKG